MRVLDMDLDFFLDNVALDQVSSGSRLSEEEYTPWDADEVREFLERRCGLSRQRRIPGKYVVDHHGAFYWWRELIRDQRLAKPFEVVHVDAHADLGAGTICYSKPYIGLDLLHKPVAERENPQEGGLTMNAGNYLLVAIACRWLSRLVYVLHPKNRLEDCEDWLFPDDADMMQAIALPKLIKPELAIPGIPLRVLEREPPVAFSPTPGSKYQDDGSFDFMVLCQSPGFTPKSSDVLIPVIQEYMQLDE